MNVAMVERPNNTPEQVREYLHAALELVAELEPPDDLRVALFTKAVELTAGKTMSAQPLAAGADGVRLLGHR